MAHEYIIGASGSGKSTLMKRLALDEIKRGSAVVFLDPHGDDTLDLTARVPTKRIKDSILFDPSDTERVISWNLFQETANIPLSADNFYTAIKGANRMSGSTPTMEMFLQALATTALLQGRTLFDTFALLDDPDELKDALAVNPVLQRFWDKYDKKTFKDRELANSSTYNKLFTLLLDTRMQSLFDTSDGKFSVANAIKDKLLFIRLPQGQLGLSKVSLIGSILLSQMHLACLKRDATIPLYIFIDEVHTFAPAIIAEMLSGLRKFNVHIVVAHQYIDQLDDQLFASLMGNCATRHIFRVSPEDAVRFQARLGRWGSHADLDELAPYRYRSFPWTAHDDDRETEPLPDPIAKNTTARIQSYTHLHYCKRV